jgi:hypothetical protein
MPVRGTLPPGWKPSREQHDYRVSEEVRLWNDGCTVMQIAAAMRPVVHDGTVRNDFIFAGLRRVKRVKPLCPDPPPVDWLHPPARFAGSPDRPAIAVRHFLAEMDPAGTGARGLSAHAHDLADARLRGDKAFEDEWDDYITRLREVVSALERQHCDASALRAAVLGRSQAVDKPRHRVRRRVKPVVRVADEPGGSGRLGGQVEHDEQDHRPGDKLFQHLTSVTPGTLIANGARL